MIIGFDAKRAFLNKSGLGNYSRTLITSLATYFQNNNYVLFTPKIQQTPFAAFIDQQHNCKVQQPETYIGKNFNAIWRSSGLTHAFARNGLQVYHGLSNELPYTNSKNKVRKVVTIHDLIFIRYPELYPFIDRQIYKFKFKSACNRADLIFATSEQTKNDIVDFFKITESKIQVVYQSCSPIFEKEFDYTLHSITKQRHHLPTNYLLYVGTIEERKNLLTLVKALNTVNDIPLVVIGKKKAYFEKVEQHLKKHNLQNRVLFLEQVTDAELVAIYQQATLFIYPSVFEGFGIPILEALWSKVPVITSLGSCFSEVGGPYTVYINPNDSEALADKINYLLSAGSEREHMREAGFKHVQQFHTQRTSEHIIQRYQNLLHG